VHGRRGDCLLARDPASKPLGRSAAHRNTVTRPRQRVQRSPCTAAGLHPAGVPFSAAAVLFDHERVTAPTDDSRGPTDKQIGRKLAALREVMGFDVEALAARSWLDVSLIFAIEAGTHSANVDELDAATLAERFGVAELTQIDDARFIAGLHLVRVGLYPNDPDATLVCDYTLGADLTDYLIAVTFDNRGRVRSLAVEN
jgi:hypothetical protein